MKAQIKTIAELEKDGWKRNARSIHGYIEIDQGVGRDSRISRYMADLCCGKEVEIIDIKYRDDGRTLIDVTVNERQVHDLPFYIFKDLDLRKMKNRVIELSSEQILRWNGMLFRFGCQSVTKKDAIRAARWVLKMAGEKSP